MNKISIEEQRAIALVVECGKRFGYGNLVSHLLSAWAAHEADEHGMDYDQFVAANSNRTGMPRLMHEDLLFRGEWDETGARYCK